MTVQPRPAASVVLVRPGARVPIESYVIRRARGMRFLGGYYAFPGGKVEVADASRETLARTHGLSAETAASRLATEPEGPPALAYWVTAVRELFEETGLLLAVDAAGRPVRVGTPAATERLEDHRRALVRGERALTAILAEEGWRADLTRLDYVAHFITPPSSPIRFSARFFLCTVPPGQAPRLILEEASEGHWVAPAEGYARFRAGEWPMAEPAEYALLYLAQYEGWDALWTHHADGRHKFHGIIDRLDAACLLAFDWEAVVRAGE